MRVRSLLAATVAAVFGVALFATGASAANAAAVTGVKIHHTFNGIAIGVENNSTSAGTYLRYQTDSDAAGQVWAVEPDTPTSFQVRNLNSGMCMSIDTTAAGRALIQLPCDSRFTEQLWRLNELNPGRFQIINEANDLCVAPTSGNNWPANTNYVRTYACNASFQGQSYVFDAR